MVSVNLKASTAPGRSAHSAACMLRAPSAAHPCGNHICHAMQWGLALQVATAGAAVGEPGTMMIGVKLQGAERWKAWGAVALFTFLAILQNMGNFMPAYLYEKVSICGLHSTQACNASSGRRTRSTPLQGLWVQTVSDKKDSHICRCGRSLPTDMWQLSLNSQLTQTGTGSQSPPAFVTFGFADASYVCACRCCWTSA